MTVTTTPLELVQYGGYILGVLGIIVPLGMRNHAKHGITVRILGLLFLAVGVAAHCAKDIMRGQIAHEVVFAELPSEWQTFYQNLNRLTDERLQEEALRRFLLRNPSRLSLDDYDAITGTKLSKWSNPIKAHKILRDSKLVREMIIFDFEEKP